MTAWKEAQLEYLQRHRQRLSLERRLRKTPLEFVRHWDRARLERKSQRRKRWYVLKKAA